MLSSGTKTNQMRTARPIYSMHFGGNWIEYLKEESDKSIVVNMRLKEKPDPITVTLRNKKMYVPMNGVAWVHEFKTFEFYARLFPWDQVPEFNVVFTDGFDVFSVPINKILDGSNVTYANESAVEKLVYVNAHLCETYKIF